jgi:hypothetical protein
VSEKQRYAAEVQLNIESQIFLYQPGEVSYSSKALEKGSSALEKAADFFF